MAIPKSYLTSAKNLPSILEAIKTAQAPEKFTIKFLESIGFTSTNDRLIIGVLKSLGFLTSDAKPTDRYYTFLDQTQSAAVLAEGIRDAYSDLFRVNINAQQLSRADFIKKMRMLGQGQLSESVLDKMALTFVELCKLADFSASRLSKVPTIDDERTEIGSEQQMARPAGGKPLLSAGLHYNIQIILPETRDTKVYDAIFRSLREHLF